MFTPVVFSILASIYSNDLAMWDRALLESSSHDGEEPTAFDLYASVCSERAKATRVDSTTPLPAMSNGICQVSLVDETKTNGNGAGDVRMQA